jgi:hypothetical protein
VSGYATKSSGESGLLNAEAIRLLQLVGGKLGNIGLAGFLAGIEPLGRDFALSEQDAVRFMTMMIDVAP